MASISQFLELPGEVRNKIYGYLLDVEQIDRSDEEPRRTAGYYSFEIHRCRFQWMTYYRSDGTPIQKVATYGFMTAILATNRQINREASKYFYGNNLFIRIKSNTDALRQHQQGRMQCWVQRSQGLTS